MDFPSRIPFVRAQGIDLIAAQAGESELHLLVRPDQENHLGMAHGGVLMTLLDVAMAQAARSVDDGNMVVTIEMKTTFLQAAFGALSARGKLLHRSGRMAFTEASVFDAQGRRCAHSTGSFRYIPAKNQPPATISPSTPGAHP